MYLQAAQAILQPIVDAQRREEERRASLTPAQRQQEDQARAVRAAEVRRTALAEKVVRATKGFTEYASFTLLEFACLLCLKNPSGYTEWVLPFDTENEEIGRLVKLLDSFVRPTAPEDDMWLAPINPHVPPREWRFARADLMRVALGNCLGHVRELAECLGVPVQNSIGRMQPPETIRAPSVAAVAPETPGGTAIIAEPALPRWQVQADSLISEIESKLCRRAIDTGRAEDLVRAEFLKECSMAAVYAEWERLNVRSAIETAEAAYKTFAEYVNGAHPWVKFRGGSRGADRRDQKCLTKLLYE
jgi:hypothetical protein